MRRNERVIMSLGLKEGERHGKGTGVRWTASTFPYQVTGRKGRNYQEINKVKGKDIYRD